MQPIVGVGLNVLVGLTGQVSIGHVGFYAIGAYVVAVLTLQGVSFWLALPAAAVVAGLIGALLAVPAMRVTGPYLAMMTIAFAFIVEHVTIEWRGVTGGQNGLMNIAQPGLGRLFEGERGLAALSVVIAGLSLYVFHRLARAPLGKAMVAVRDSETAARAVGYNPVIVKTVAFALSAAFTGLAGGLFASLMTFVAPSSFPFSQSILFLLAVIVGGAGYTLGPVLGAAVIVVLPELIACARRVPPAAVRRAAAGRAVARAGGHSRHARPLLAPLRRRAPPLAPASTSPSSSAAATARRWMVSGLTIAFGGVRAATDVCAHRGARPRHRPDRAQRRRQDHRAQHDRRLLPARRRQHPPRRRASLPARRPGRSPAPASPAPTRPRSCSARSASSTTC